MARLTIKKEQQIFQENILNRQEKITIDYSIFFEERPTFVTYYQVNKRRTSIESTLEDNTALLGNDSPVKYDIIENFPIYRLNGLDSLSVDQDDFGKEHSIEGTGVVIPRMIEPMEDDFFVVNYDARRYLFLINDVNQDSINGVNFYEISFKFDYRNEEELKRQLSGDTFITDYDNIGTEFKPILKKDDKVLIDHLSSLYNAFFGFIKSAFYYNGANLIRFDMGSAGYLYDPYLTKFIEANDLLIKINIKESLESIYISNVYLGERQMYFINKNYKSTIFSAIEARNHNKLANLAHSTYPNMYVENELESEGYEYMVSEYNPSIISTAMQPFDTDFLTRVQSNTLYGTPDYIMDDIIIQFINNSETLTPTTLVDLLNDIDIEDDYRAFVKSNILLYIIKYFIFRLSKF